MPGEKAAEGGGIKELSGKSGFIILLTTLVMLLDLLNFGDFWMGRYITEGDWFDSTHHIETEVWPQFIDEANYYYEKGSKPTVALLDFYNSLDREKLGNSAPLLDFLFLKVVRAAVFLLYLIGGCIFLFFISIEALKRNADKRLKFEHRSSTIYHFTLNTGIVTVGSVFFVYVFMPGKINIPKLIEFNIPHAFSLPQPWVLLLVGSMSYLIYLMLVNLSYKA